MYHQLLSGPLAQQIESQIHEPPDDNVKRAVQQDMRQVKNQYPKEKLDKVRAVTLNCHSEGCV